MPYDPRQMQAIGRMGLGMMAPEPSPFDRNTPGRTPQWWEQPLPQRKDQPADQNADPSQAPYEPRRPPSLMEMMMGAGLMPRTGSSKSQAKQPPAVTSPWAYLGGFVGSGEPPR